MQTPVNKNIDNYKDDFFKGMSLKQTAMCALTLAAGVGSFFLFHLLLGLPQTISLYLVFPVALPFALLGFAKPDGTSLFIYLRRRHEVMVMPEYHSVPNVFVNMNAGSVPKPADVEKEKTDITEPLLGPFDENILNA